MTAHVLTIGIWLAAACVLPGLAAVATNEPASALSKPLSAAVILARVRAGLPQETLLIKGRLLRGERLGRLEQAFLIEVLLAWGRDPPTARYTLRDAFGASLACLTVIRAPGREPEFRYEKGSPLRTAAVPDLNEPIAGTEITWNDLSLAFLWWPDGTVAGRDNIRGRDCLVIEMKPPASPGAARPGTSQAPADLSDARDSLRLWIDDHLLVLIQMEEYNAAGKLLRRLSVKNFKKIAGLWMVKNMDIRRYPSNQRTQIRVDDVTANASSNAPDMDLGEP